MKPEPKAIGQMFATALNHHRSGQLREAEKLYKRILSADPTHARTLHLLGVVAHQTGRSDRAVDLIGRAIARDDQVTDFHYDLGVVSESLGRFESAEAHYRNAAALNPNHANASLNLGNVLLKQGKLAAAETASRHALGLNQRRPEAHFNLGLILAKQGRHAEAVTQFQEVLALVPNLAAAHAALGAALSATGDIEKATGHCRRALELDPRNHLWAVNLGLFCLAQGDHEHALAAALHALALNENSETRSLFTRAVRFARPTADDADLRALLTRALAEYWGRPAHLVAPALSLVKTSPGVKSAIERQRAGAPRALPADGTSDLARLAALSGDALLVQLLRSECIGDAEMERVFTAARRDLLDLATRDPGSVPVTDEGLQFSCALAQQCFINEYVYAASEAEWRDVRALEDALVAALRSGTQPPPLWIASLGAYVPLGSSPCAEYLSGRSWPPPVAALLKQQIDEPRLERDLIGSIPSLTEVEDDVSLEVKRQYEENPYPRWVGTRPVPAPVTLDAHLTAKFPHASYKPVGKEQIEVLVAGCGTGLHAIETGQQFIAADVLAVDLSAASLAYALRKTRETGQTKINYAVADILKIAALGRSFDLIEASGVLHHLADPWAAWRLLLSILRPGGIMNIGLYSELGRADVVRARAFIAERGFPATAEGIRRCRQEMLSHADDPLLRQATERLDFFSTSNCRDLLFHVQESRVTLPQIAEFMAANALTFLGFDAEPELLHRYAQRYPADTAKTDLAAWHEFETEHPKSFAGMYQLWVQKAG